MKGSWGSGYLPNGERSHSGKIGLARMRAALGAARLVISKRLEASENRKKDRNHKRSHHGNSEHETHPSRQRTHGSETNTNEGSSYKPQVQQPSQQLAENAPPLDSTLTVEAATGGRAQTMADLFLNEKVTHSTR